MRLLGTALADFVPAAQFTPASTQSSRVEDGQKITDYDLDGDGQTDVRHRQGPNDASVQLFRRGEQPRRDTYHAKADGRIDSAERLEYFRAPGQGDAYTWISNVDVQVSKTEFAHVGIGGRSDTPYWMRGVGRSSK